MSVLSFQHRSAAYPTAGSRRTDAGLDWKQDFMITPPVSKLYQAISAFSASNKKVPSAWYTHHCWVAAEYCPFTWKQSQAPQRVSNLCHHTSEGRAGALCLLSHSVPLQSVHNYSLSTYPPVPFCNQNQRWLREKNVSDGNPPLLPSSFSDRIFKNFCYLY